MQRQVIIGDSVNPAVRSDARGVAVLNGDWLLRVDPRNRGMAEGWARSPIASAVTCVVPGCIQSVLALSEEYPHEYGMPNGYLGTAWLERCFDAGDVANGQRAWLKFGGLAPSAHVWLNGSYVGAHCHPASAVKWDITGMLHPQTENRVTVAIVEENIGMLGGMRNELEWSGIYRGVELEITDAVHIEETYLRPDIRNERLLVTAQVHNSDDEPATVTAAVSVETWETSAHVADMNGGPLTIEAGAVETVSLEVKVAGIRLWSDLDPFLHTATLSLAAEDKVRDAATVRFGMRTFGAQGSGLQLNGSPFMARGDGSEYSSPAISPVTDKTTIRSMFQSLKDLGFNFHRYHTYVPTDEELDVADEIGFLLSTEISVLSNFNRVTPCDEGMVALREHVLQTRNHPSLAIYCLGNETSQIMTWREEERDIARAGYRTLKEAAPDHAAIVGFGIQGEHPDIPNDIETPHLWSQHFTWAYSGLTQVPWRLLAPLAKRRPCIIHEYGKYCVWPDPADDALYHAAGLQACFGKQAHAALEAAGLADLEPGILENSRRLAWLCHRIAIEQARRLPGVDGYTVWSGWRALGGARGLVDDTGTRHDLNPALLHDTCNAPVALLIDRDFAGRNLRAGEHVEMELTVSNFGQDGIAGAQLAWQLEAGNETLAEGHLQNIEAPLGENRSVGRVCVDVPRCARPLAAVMSVRMEQGGKPVAANAWGFWIFPQAVQAGMAPIVHDVDQLLERRLLNMLPGSTGIKGFDSMCRGCRALIGTDCKTCLEQIPDALLIADRWTHHVEQWLQLGKNVLLLDNEHFPEDWYPDPTGENAPAKDHMPDDEAERSEIRPPRKIYDQNRFFAPFRSGWDQGNLGTIITEHPALAGFPHDGFCDLQFFTMIQGSRALEIEPVAARCDATAVTVPIRLIAKSGKGPFGLGRHIKAANRAYLAEFEVGPARLMACSLNCLDDPAGLYLLNRILVYLSG